MSDRRFVVIANPHAGRGQAEVVLQQVVAGLQAAGAEAGGELTTSIGHAADLAGAAAADGGVAVAVGGDGLVRAVAAGASRHRGTVGLVPAGRGNDFARTVGIAKDGVDANIRTLLQAEPRPTDCIAVTGGAPRLAGASNRAKPAPGPGTPNDAGDGAVTDVALGNVYAGFDSLSNVTANALRWNLGEFSYTYAALRVALTMPVLDIVVTVDGDRHAYRGSGVAIGNSRFYGGNVPFAPDADVHDGLLDVVMFEQTGARSRVATLWAMRSGEHLGRAGVRVVRGQEVHVEITPTLEAYSDGDPIAHTPLTATVMPGAIGLLRP